MYKPLQVKPNLNYAKETTLMAKLGIDHRDLPQLLSPEYALGMTNYLVTTDGGLQRRKGMTSYFSQSSTSAITAIVEWKGYIMFAYDKYLKAYNTSTGAFTTVKTLGAAHAFSLAVYGDYLFAAFGDHVDYITESSGTFTVTSIASSPHSNLVKAIGPRIFAATTNPGEVAYSNVDTGANPPCATWTVAATADAGGLVSYRQAGTVNAIEALGDNVVVFCDNGKYAFQITTIDVSGTLTKQDKIIMSRLDMGGAAGAITTPKGLFYVNRAGLWQLISIGQPNIPFSDQEGLTSILLGTTYFDNITLTNCDITYDAKINTLYVTCAKDSTINNFVLAYNTENKAFSELTGWNINRFYKNASQVIYGGSSTKATVYKLFDGWSDDGKDVWYEFYQELKSGDLETRQELLGQYVQGFLSPSSVINISFDIYDTKGVLIPRKLEFNWQLQESSLAIDGFGGAKYGTSPYGGDVDFAGMVEAFDGGRFRIKNYQRIRVRFSGNDKVGHVINWFKMETRSKIKIRRRKLSQ